MDLIESVKATYAVIGHDVSDVGLRVMVEALSHYPGPDVLLALSRCRAELRRLTLADVLNRLPGQHPGPEEAWAIVGPCVGDESLTVVWTHEMRVAFGLAFHLHEDAVGARMAFKEHYTRLVGEARARGERPTWVASLGSDKAQRERAVLDGVTQGRLSDAYAHRLLPREAVTTAEAVRILDAYAPRLLP